MIKTEIRKTLLEKRRGLPNDFIRTASREITKNIIDSNILINASNVLVYLPINKEVSTLELVDFLGKKRVNIFVPAFSNDMWVISSYDEGYDLNDVFLGVPQPKKIRLGNISNLDLIIMPGVAFDNNGARLGMGLAIYDKLLRSSNATKVGLAFDFQVVPIIGVEPHDVSVDYIITEKRVLKII